MEITLKETLEITFSSMIIVFSILALIMAVIYLFKFLPEEKQDLIPKKKESIPFEEMDEDMKVAVLVATIECQNEYKKNVRLKSVKRI